MTVFPQDGMNVTKLSKIPKLKKAYTDLSANFCYMCFVPPSTMYVLERAGKLNAIDVVKQKILGSALSVELMLGTIKGFAASKKYILVNFEGAEKKPDVVSAEF